HSERIEPREGSCCQGKEHRAKSRIHTLPRNRRDRVRRRRSAWHPASTRRAGPHLHHARGSAEKALGGEDGYLGRTRHRWVALRAHVHRDEPRNRDDGRREVRAHSLTRAPFSVLPPFSFSVLSFFFVIRVTPLRRHPT